MSARPFHKRYHSDALAGFMSLDLEERGAYQTLLDLIYDRGGPIQDNERLLAGYMGCSVRKWRTLRDQLLEKRKIKLNRAGEITNLRAEKELENDAKTTRKLAENGLKGARVRAEKSETPEKPKENNETEQAGLQRGSSEAKAYARVPEAIVREEVSRTREPVREIEPTPFELRCRKLADTINLTRPIAASDRDQVRAWDRDGLHFDWHVIEAAKLVAAREAARHRAIGGFKYLDGAVREYHAEWVAERQRLEGAA